MRLQVFAFLYVFALSTGVGAASPMVEIIERFDDLRMVAFVDQANIDASPAWNPGVSPIPLPVDEAIQSVKAFNKASDNAAAIEEIEIRKIPGDEQHWHYLVKIADDRMTTKYSVYLVLMTGKVVPAIIEPESYK